MNLLRTLIVDDEKPARVRMRRMLKERGDIQILAECRDGKKAIETIRSLNPDLVFLDIQMPELNGLDVVQELASAEAPSIVFVSAYSEHAVKAFEVNALDYLLKPFNANRLDAAIERVQSRYDSNAVPGNTEHQDVAAKLEQASRREFADRIALKSGGRLHLIEFSRIDWIEAARNYVRVHADRKQYLLRKSLSDLEKRLDQRFVRIHRSTIINIDRVETLERTVNGDYRVFLKDGSTVTLSRNYKAAMQTRFGDQI